MSGESPTERIRRLLRDFAHAPQPARQAFRKLLDADPGGFFPVAVAAVLEDPSSAGSQYLLSLLLARGLIPNCDPQVVTLEQEIELCRALSAQVPNLETKLAHRILAGVSSEPDRTGEAERALHILAGISDGPKLAPVLVQLLRHDNARVRSKAALMLARASRNPGTAEGLLADPDARVRANAIEALWGIDSPEARKVLWRAVTDDNHRVAGNGLLGLIRLGEDEASARVRQLASSSDPHFRATAAWVMGAAGDTSFLPELAAMIRDSEPHVRRTVFGAIQELNRVRREPERFAMFGDG